MQNLLDLFRHNAWANARVFGLAAALGDRLIDTDAPGTQGTVHSTLAHLARVERAYLTLLHAHSLDAIEPREAYQAHDLVWFAGEMRDVGSAYVAAIESWAPESLERDLHIPWFTFPVTAREGLLQVLTHSAQHRAQVLAWLASQGVETPDLDYVVMLGELRSA